MKKCELFTLDNDDIKFTGETIIGLMKKVEEENKDQTKPLKSKHYWELKGMLACLCTLDINYEILWDYFKSKKIGIIIEDMEFKIEEK